MPFGYTDVAHPLRVSKRVRLGEVRHEPPDLPRPVPLGRDRRDTIVYNIVEHLAEAGHSTYRIRKEKILSESTTQKLRRGGTVIPGAIDTLCRLLGCQPAYLMAYIPGWF